MTREYERNEVAPQTPVIKRTHNHINEHCTSVFVMAMGSAEGQRLVLQFGRDAVELADGSTRGDNKVQTIQHTFANLTIDSSEAVRMAEAILRLVKEHGERGHAGS
ncbi:hypothetical protein [Pseudomonas moraviensis]|uniref:Uncharacterized protein n=1 Tax=Pseudomonas moraviensis R28-S TaxID=1395516 RepID=V8REU0_9PSED|nr:hypothetical protein [Pseudomonas moraviensis]ETF09789.1 hypothetical protein PMO01_05085 [Pseudomonas moraviensis R28-S]